MLDLPLANWKAPLNGPAMNLRTKILFLATSAIATNLIAGEVFGQQQPSAPLTTFVPSSAPADIVYDSSRDILYITAGTSLLRYHVDGGRFAAPMVLGGSLKGIDLAPDASFVAIADDSNNGSSDWIHILDTTTNATKKLTLPLAYSESGTWSVVIGYDNSILSTSTFSGSGWVPFRRIDLVTSGINVIAQVRQWSMLSTNAQRNVVGIAEADISDGEFNRYVFSTGVYNHRSGYTDGTAWFNYEIAVNPTGDQFAIPTYGGTFLFDGSLSHSGQLGQYATNTPLASAYDPTDGSLYLSIAGTSRLDHYDPITLELLGSIDIGKPLVNAGNYAFVNGRMRFTADGRFLFVTTNTGIVIVTLHGEPPDDIFNTAFE